MSAAGGLSRALRAYPTMLRVGLAEAVAYRAEMVVWMLTTTMPLVSLALWSAVAETAPVGGFTQRGFVSYFLATLFIRQITGSWLVWELNQEIKSGTLSRRLLRPIHPLIAFSAENLAALPIRAVIVSPLFAVWVFTLDRPEGGAPPILAIFASLVGAWLINFFTMALIGSLAFFLESSTSIFELWMVAFMLLSGYLVPLGLFPPTLRAITHALPFRYTIAFPVELANGTLPPGSIARELATQWAFVAGLGLAAILAFRAGVKRFSAFGG
jgi:ABC-2 type transport system permease protein